MNQMYNNNNGRNGNYNDQTINNVNHNSPDFRTGNHHGQVISNVNSNVNNFSNENGISMGNYLHNLSPLHKNRKNTNIKSLTFFVFAMAVYSGVAIYAFTTGQLRSWNDVLEEESNNYIDTIKIDAHSETQTTPNTNVILGIIAATIISTALGILCMWKLLKVLIILSIIGEFMVYVSFIIRFLTTIYFGIVFEIIMWGLFLLSLLLIAYVRIYAICKVGIDLMEKVITLAVRAVFKFPFAVIVSAISVLLELVLFFFGIRVFLYLRSTEISTFLRILFHFFNFCGTVYVITAIYLLNEVILSNTFGTWFWTMDKSTCLFNQTSKSIAISTRYHIGTTVYASHPWAFFYLISIMINNLNNRSYRSCHNFIVMIVCWLNVFFSLGNFTIVTAIHGTSFKKSVNRLCQVYLRFPLRLYAISMAQLYCVQFLTTFFIIPVTIICTIVSTVGITYNDAGQSVIELQLFINIFIALSCFMFITFPIIITLCIAIKSLFFCILEDTERIQKDHNAPCFLEGDIKWLMMKPE